MTEADWLVCADPDQLLTQIRHTATGRKLRLLAVAGARPVAFRLTIPEYRDAIQKAEEWAESPGGAAELEPAYGTLWTTYYHDRRLPHDSLERKAAFAALACLSPDPHRAASCAPFFACHATTPYDPLTSRAIAALLRCVFGNPFRPVAVDPSWLTSTVVALAEGIYAERAFDRLPILADALQDAGCDHADVLAHCRGDGPHVRGCWVVDLVLGKS